jgi:hypothetical protein
MLECGLIVMDRLSFSLWPLIVIVIGGSCFISLLWLWFAKNVVVVLPVCFRVYWAGGISFTCAHISG